MASPTLSPTPRTQRWYRPTVSLEHGVYVMLLVSFLTGVVAAQRWTWATSLALLCALCAFQAEHPLVLQVKQRSSWKPRFLLWAGLYGGVAGAIALWLLQHNPAKLLLLLLYVAVAIALSIDVALVWRRQQKAIANELITFFAVCLAAPLAYATTAGEMSWRVLALWMMNGLVFDSLAVKKLETHVWAGSAVRLDFSLN
ncbi:YwiC-like family protein [Nodosilinea sp. LEGE 07298]|nr:YwiC-like family protein [Nodosilinea sp. LEGE 07298]